MSNALSKLVALAEFRTASLITNAVESVAGPIRTKSQEIVGEVVDTVTRTLKTVLIKAGLGLFAAVMIIVAVVEALSALYFVLLPSFGPVYARLILAGGFVVVAVVALAVLVLWPTARPAATKAAAEARAAANDAASDVDRLAADAKAAARDTQPAPAAADPPAGPTEMKAGFEAIIKALGDAGFRREQAGLRAGMALASQLKPAQIVSLALIGGFVAGIRHRRRR